MNLRFVVCRCGQHAHFENRHGDTGPFVVSKQEARNTLDDALLRNLLTQAQVMELFAQVQASGLTETPEDACPLIRDLVHQWGLMSAVSNGNLKPDSFHELLDPPRPI